MTILSVICFRAALALSALFLFAPPAAAIDPIKVGVMMAPSPTGSTTQGQETRDGLEIARKMINDGGGALGRPIELIYAAASPDAAGAAVEKLITQDKVVAVVGAHEPAGALAGVELAHQYKIPFITDARSHAINEKLYPEVYNSGISDSEIAHAIADTMKALGVKRVLAFTENNDSGIELANLVARELNNSELGIAYSFEALNPAAQDFTPVLEPHKANPPDMIVQMLRAPAAYGLLDQLQRQGLGATPKTQIYDAASLIEDPTFWQHTKDTARGMLVFGLDHPKVTLPDLGRKVADAYAAQSKREPNRMLLQAADSLFLVAEAIKTGGSSEPEAITKALESTKWTGTRGKITFSTDKSDAKYHQWLDVPYVIYQIMAVNQPIGETNLVQAPGQPLDVSRIQKTW